MKFIERVNNIFNPSSVKPGGFEHNSKFDMFLLMDVAHCIPELVSASDGHSYVYFETMDADALLLARQMGFNPRMHKSQKYLPAKNIYRARVSKYMPVSAHNVVRELSNRYKLGMYGIEQDISDMKAQREYIEYIAQYKLATRQK